MDSDQTQNTPISHPKLGNYLFLNLHVHIFMGPLSLGFNLITELIDWFGMDSEWKLIDKSHFVSGKFYFHTPTYFSAHYFSVHTLIN